MSQHSFQTLSDWLTYIEALHPSEIEMGLERIKQVYNQLPQFPKSLAVITVAGTNGKGSTVRTIEALARAKGLRTGSYTSPHLIAYNERVQINQEPVEDQLLIEAFQHVDAARGDVQLTYFEFGTLAALVILAQANLDLVVLEVGLGGRLDAVNIVDPDVAVVTTVAMDHESWLGNTREAIAYEKAGIVREDSIFVCGEAEPLKALVQASEKASSCYQVGRDFYFSKDSSGISLSWTASGDLQTVQIDSEPLVLPQNLLNGLQSLCALGYSYSGSELNEVVQRITLAGRHQVIQEKPYVIVDVGHNPQAAEALASKLVVENQRRGIRSCYCVLGMLSDKNHANTLAELLHVVDEWFVCDLDAGSRAAPASVLEETLLEAGASVNGRYSSPKEAFRELKGKATAKDAIVVFGSFYTVADILSEA